MTQDEIIEMARQAGLDPDLWNYTDAFEAFAKLVAAAEREEFAAHAVDIARRAVAEEREACAKVCDDIDKSHWGCEVKASWCSDAIRARGKHEAE